MRPVKKPSVIRIRATVYVLAADQAMKKGERQSPFAPKQWSRTISRVLYPCGGDRHSSRSTITRTLKQPTRRQWPGRPYLPSYLVLLRAGFTWPGMSPCPPVGSYPTVSPLPAGPKPDRRSAFCCTFRGSLPLGVTQRSALRSPDFPPRSQKPRGDDPSNSVNICLLVCIVSPSGDQGVALDRAGRDAPLHPRLVTLLA